MSIKAAVTGVIDQLWGRPSDSPVQVKPFSYSVASAPEGYKCHECKKSGVKLWREYQTFLDHQTLSCAVCGLKRAIASSGKSANESKYKGEVGDDGKVAVVYSGMGEMRTDQLGWLVPAVPTEDGSTYWGYSSVPIEGVSWWHSLPTHKR